MSRLSNTHTVQISSSALASAIVGMPSNSWRTLTVNGLTSSLIAGGGTDDIFSWGRKCYWDAPRGRLLYYGMSHNSGGGGVSRIIQYIVATNTWSLENGNVAADPDYPSPEGNHGYDQMAYRPSDGQLFIKRSKTGRVFTRTATNTTNSWSELTTIPGVQFWDWGTADALQYHPGLNGGAGGLVHCGPNAIYISNAAVSSWTVLQASSPAPGVLAMQAINNQLDGDTVYIGGGDVTNIWRIANNGTLTLQGNAPVQYSTDPWAQGGQSSIFRGPGTQKPFIIRSNGTINEYTYETNSWSGTITTIPFSPGNGGVFIGGPIDSLNVSVFQFVTSAAFPSTTMHIWKR